MTDLCKGVLQKLPSGGAFLRDPDRSFLPGPNDTFVSSKLIREFNLTEGAFIIGTRQKNKKGNQLISLNLVCGSSPAQFKERSKFDRLTAIDPNERFRIGQNGNTSARIIELITPIGKGTRALIVAPPKSGKTQLLENIARALYDCDPESRIIVLLIDERPEEVTHFRRQVPVEVLASSNDQSVESHLNLAELTLAHIRSELECGNDVVVLVDSITRISRAFNLGGKNSRRTLSGGLDSRALEIPRRFFGLARNIENGGSVTVIATAQIDTGSRMDNFIFEEFKGTGNCEIVLDRKLAEKRIFPAINILASGTRKEELLYDESSLQKLALLRRMLADQDPQTAMNSLLRLVENTENNEELLQKLGTLF